MEIFIDCVVIFGMFALAAVSFGFVTGLKLADSDSDVSKRKSDSWEKSLTPVSTKATVRLGYSFFVWIFPLGAVIGFYIGIFCWSIGTYIPWVIQHVGFHDGHYAPFWPHILLFSVLVLMGSMVVYAVGFSLRWCLNRLLLRVGFLKRNLSK